LSAVPPTSRVGMSLRVIVPQMARVGLLLRVTVLHASRVVVQLATSGVMTGGNVGTPPSLAEELPVEPKPVPLRVRESRRLSFGTRGAGGSHFVETMPTVIEDCRQQTRDVFAYVTAAVQAHSADQPTPSLLLGA
jgi:hypothetical protein